MDFIDELKQFSARVLSLKDRLPTEEATKNALILPFFQMLGYDVFNPLEFMPEYSADVGIKKGEKVDYAILLNEKPAILIEAKWCGESLDKHDSQLFRYFGTTQAKFGILTNGIIYKFYTDLDEPNKMDLTPFLEFDLLDIKESAVPEIKRFSKEKIDIGAAFTAASELKYTNLIKALIHKQRTAPDENFINFVLGSVYQGRRTQPVVDRFTSTIKKALNAYINDVINDTLKSAMLQHDDIAFAPVADSGVVEEIAAEEPAQRIVTTQMELEAYAIIKTLLRGVLPVEAVTHKDTESYLGILYKNNSRKWICRIKVTDERCVVYVPVPGDRDMKITLGSIDELYQHADVLIESGKRFAE